MQSIVQPPNASHGLIPKKPWNPGTFSRVRSLGFYLQSPKSTLARSELQPEGLKGLRSTPKHTNKPLCLRPALALMLVYNACRQNSQNRGSVTILRRSSNTATGPCIQCQPTGSCFVAFSNRWHTSSFLEQIWKFDQSNPNSGSFSWT